MVQTSAVPACHLQDLLKLKFFARLLCQAGCPSKRKQSTSSIRLPLFLLAHHACLCVGLSEGVSIHLHACLLVWLLSNRSEVIVQTLCIVHHHQKGTLRKTLEERGREVSRAPSGHKDMQELDWIQH